MSRYAETVEKNFLMEKKRKKKIYGSVRDGSKEVESVWDRSKDA